MNRPRGINLLALPVLVLAAGTALAGSTAITECGFAITEPGNYMLTQDLLDCPGGGVGIYSSDVLLDLKGHSIACADELVSLVSGVVVAGPVDPVRNVTVRNGQVSNCHDGVVLVNVTDSKVTRMTSTGNRAYGGPYSYGTGITVYLSHSNVISHNLVSGNQNQGIGIWESSGNTFKHNRAFGNGGEGVLSLYSTDSLYMCNQVVGNFDGMAISPFSTGNLLQGNYSAENWFSGITLFGWAYAGDLFLDIPGDNILRLNITEYNGYADLIEAFWDDYFWYYFPHPDGVCPNTWDKNRYGTQIAAAGCIPASFDLETVCALDDDD